jgi:hypothetical protein
MSSSQYLCDLDAYYTVRIGQAILAPAGNSRGSVMTRLCRRLIRARSRGCRAAEPGERPRRRQRRGPRKGLTVGTGVVGGSVDGAVGEQLQVAVLDEHLDLASGAGDVGEVGAAFAAGRGVLQGRLWGRRRGGFSAAGQSGLGRGERRGRNHTS